jgi:hypothetical protein
MTDGDGVLDVEDGMVVAMMWESGTCRPNTSHPKILVRSVRGPHIDPRANSAEEHVTHAWASS